MSTLALSHLVMDQGPGWTGVLVLIAMVVAAATIAANRAKGLPGAFWVSLQGIGFGAGVVIALMTWLGVMAGMILAGEDPVYAAIYQFVVIAMIFAASGLTSIASVLLIRSRAFSSAQQLVVRPGVGEEG